MLVFVLLLLSSVVTLRTVFFCSPILKRRLCLHLLPQLSVWGNQSAQHFDLCVPNSRQVTPGCTDDRPPKRSECIRNTQEFVMKVIKFDFLFLMLMSTYPG